MSGDERSDGPASKGGSKAKDVDVEAPTRLGDAPGPEPLAETRVDAETGEPGEPAVAPTVVVDDDASDDPLAEAETIVRPRADPPASAADEPDAVDVDAPTRVSARSYELAEGSDAPAPLIGIEPGSILFGEYEIIEVLGAGGMGEVYRARHRRLDEFRAIKMMHAELATREGANEFFLREAKALLAVRHPAVVHCHDLLSDEQGRVYLVMEMIDGVPLSDRIAESKLPADQVVVLGARLAAGLQAAHACGVVHRDVSPDNVVLPEGDVSKAKLIDFGIAKILEEGQGTIVDGFKGKLSYASPEQLGFFGGKLDGRSDFYSLGLVLCAAVLGKPMGMGTTVVEAVDARRGFHRVPDEIPVGLRSAIEPLLALDPKERPSSADRLFLAPGSEQAGLEAMRAEVARSRPAPSSSAGWLRIALAAAAALIGVGGYLMFGGGEVGRPGAGAPAATEPAPTEAARAPIPKAPEPAAAPEPATKKLSALDELRIVGLLRGAETAISENRLQSPKGDNAYEKYRSVLAIDPENQSARRGLVTVAGRYLQLAEGALSKGEVEKAGTYLARAAAIAPDHPGLDEMRTAIDAAPAP